MLEMAGVPYTGATPLGHAVSLDKVVAKVLMRAAGVPTPAAAVMAAPAPPRPGMRYPLIVKPRHESTSCGVHLAGTREQLDEAVRAVVAKYAQEALVEEYVDGREVCVGLLGNDPPEALPVVELDFSHRASRLVTRGDKFHRTEDEPARLCPAPLPEATARELQQIAVATFEACHCRDYARVDIRLDADGRPQVLEINSTAPFVALVLTGGDLCLPAAPPGAPGPPVDPNAPPTTTTTAPTTTAPAASAPAPSTTTTTAPAPTTTAPTATTAAPAPPAAPVTYRCASGLGVVGQPDTAAAAAGR